MIIKLIANYIKGQPESTQYGRTVPKLKKNKHWFMTRSTFVWFIYFVNFVSGPWMGLSKPVPFVH